VGSTIVRRGLIAPEESVLVALSAGPDSTALVAALAELRDAGRIGALRALHVDHGLRAGGEEDARCARETCERLAVPFESIRVEVGAGNVQAAARRARYQALRDAAARHGAARIATGHTLSDQAETFLMRALRGAGARGLSAIPPRRGPIVRPLIDVARDEVIAFLEERGLRWREDPTNRSPRYARNAIRLSLVPVLRRLEPRFERALARAADLLRDDERALSRRGRALVSERGSVDLTRLDAEPRAVRRRVVRALWRPAAPGARSLGASQVEAILALCGRGRPGRLSLPRGVEARVAYGRLSLERARPAAASPSAVVQVAGPGTFRLGDLIVAVAAAPGAGASPPFPLVLRGRRPGDRIRPVGAPGAKKLKAWLIDRKVPRERRDALAVLADADGNVLALPEMGVRCVGAGALAVTVRRASEP
jgi:tRNA(Ile)-lysidine synthase